MLKLKKCIRNMAALSFSASVFLTGVSEINAATSTTTFQVTAAVVSSCTISASGLAFGNYTLAVLDGTTTVVVTCTNGATYNVGLSAGTGSGATVAIRKMTSSSPAGTLNYSLYSDASRSVVWGNTVGTDTVAGTGSGAGQTLTVYGRIPASQASPVSSAYNDTITATVTF